MISLSVTASLLCLFFVDEKKHVFLRVWDVVGVSDVH